MRFLLDTNTCIYIIKQQPIQVLERFQAILPSEVCISSITVAELEYGVSKSQRQMQNQVALEKFLTPLTTVPFDSRTTRTYGQIRADLEKQGNLIGPMDLLIAAQAVSLDLTLITNNVREFSRIPELKLDNWAE